VDRQTDEEVTDVQNRGTISGVMIVLILSISAAQASEVWVKQSSGRISGGTPVTDESKPKAAPEGSSTAAAAGSPTNPATCNQQNASSPACYSATQQSKGK
jgi:hypothetical protein